MNLENVTAQDLIGWFFCYCGAKYWGDFESEVACVSCGESAKNSWDNPRNAESIDA